MNNRLHRLTRYGLFLWTGLSFTNGYAFDLQSAQLSIHDKQSLSINQLYHNGKLYNFITTFYGDGSYSLVDATSQIKATQYDGGNGTPSTSNNPGSGVDTGIDFRTGYVRATDTNALRLFEIQYNGRKINVTLTSTQLGYWVASQINDSTFKLSSTSVNSDTGAWDVKYTCRGVDKSPALEWYGAPSNAASFTIIMDDPDAKDTNGQAFVHWNIYNLSSGMNGLVSGISKTPSVPTTATEGLNSFNKVGYNGPCPSGQKHRYYIRVYALNSKILAIPSTPLSRAEFERQYSKYILGWGETFGDFGP